MATPSVSAIIPAFNEAHSIGTLIQALRKMSMVSEVLVVDDGSTDGTADVARQFGARVVTHPINRGNGASIKTGIRQAQGDILVFMDADGQHNPDDLPKLVAEVERYDMVVGARSYSHQASAMRWLANAVYNQLASYVSRYKIEDLTCGFRCVRRELARRHAHLLPNTFSSPSTLTLALLRAGHCVKYIPIDGKQRSSASQSKIRPVRDGLRFLIIIVKIAMLVSPLRVFLPVSIMFIVLGLLNYAYTFTHFHRFTNMSALLITSGILVFMLGLVAEQIAMVRMEHTEDVRGDL